MGASSLPISDPSPVQNQQPPTLSWLVPFLRQDFLLSIAVPCFLDYFCLLFFRRVSETPTPTVSKEVRQYTSNLYGSAPPICIAGPSWLLSLEEREIQQYTSHLYCSTPPICTAVRLPFVRQYFWENTGGWGHRKVPDFWGSPKASHNKITQQHCPCFSRFWYLHSRFSKFSLCGISSGPCFSGARQIFCISLHLRRVLWESETVAANKVAGINSLSTIQTRY